MVGNGTQAPQDRSWGCLCWESGSQHRLPTQPVVSLAPNRLLGSWLPTAWLGVAVLETPATSHHGRLVGTGTWRNHGRGSRQGSWWSWPDRHCKTSSPEQSCTCSGHCPTELIKTPPFTAGIGRVYGECQHLRVIVCQAPRGCLGR